MQVEDNYDYDGSEVVVSLNPIWLVESEEFKPSVCMLTILRGLGAKLRNTLVPSTGERCQKITSPKKIEQVAKSKNDIMDFYADKSEWRTCVSIISKPFYL